ncbi:MAG: SsrA-binding protein SmpB [Candidatus Omnitrophica bacterium]|nr:SsrA-binding protein SmpB [Candidatus Omnitrophota bacterium]
MSKDIAVNKQAFRDYTIFERMECGIELKGSEVKSVRAGRVNFKDSFARIENGEVLLYNTHISPYFEASYMNVEALRVRKLLLHKIEIAKLFIQVSQKGFTLVPLKAYFNSRGFVKIELAVCKGKRSFDKRDDIKRKEAELDISRVLKSRRR